MRRIHILFAASLLLACNKNAASTSPPAEEHVADPNAGPPEPPSEDCAYQVKGTCYKEQDEACKAAGCEPDKCIALESFPAQIQCS